MLPGALLRQVLVASFLSALQHAEAICRLIIQHPRRGDWVFRAFFFLHTIPLASSNSSRSVSPSWIISPRIVSYRVGRNLTIRWYASLIQSHSLLFHCCICYGRYTWFLGRLSRVLDSQGWIYPSGASWRTAKSMLEPRPLRPPVY
jgi:hypothetical protein